MSGSARSLQASMFSGLRVARTDFTPEYSKNGKNVSAKLTINAFMNMATRANNGAGSNDAVPFTVWGKLAHICAKSMSPGKEFNCTATLHVYDGRVFMPSGIPNQPGTPIAKADGTPLMVKKFSYTIQLLTFGEESDKHINNEIQAGPQVRPAGWNIAGSQDALLWKEILKQRQAVAFNPAAPTYGYARVRMPQGAGIAAYIQNQPAAIAGVGAAVDTAAVVAASLAGINPVGSVALPGGVAVPGVVAAPPVVASGFVVPGV